MPNGGNNINSIHSRNILNSFLHKVCVGDFLHLENYFFEYPPFEKYTYQILSKSDDTVTVSTKKYAFQYQVVQFRFNKTGTVFINLKNNTAPPDSQNFSIIVEVEEDEDEEL